MAHDATEERLTSVDMKSKEDLDHVVGMLNEGGLWLQHAKTDTPLDLAAEEVIVSANIGDEMDTDTEEGVRGEVTFGRVWEDDRGGHACCPWGEMGHVPRRPMRPVRPQHT